MSEQFERGLARIRSMLTVGAVLDHKMSRLAKPKRKWFGTWPANCDFCKVDLRTTELFVDGRTQKGPWALMCPDCHEIHGVGTGLGCGQAYESDTLEKFAG